MMRKGGMKAGDVLLTKPIGTGTLFAARNALRAKGRWIDAALQSMVVSNRRGALILTEHRATAATDLTDFGLLGQLYCEIAWSKATTDWKSCSGHMVKRNGFKSADLE